MQKRYSNRAPILLILIKRRPHSVVRCDTLGIDASIEDNFCTNLADVQQNIEHVLIRAKLRQKQNCCSDGGSVGDTLGITSARMKNKLFLNNFCSNRAEHIPSVSSALQSNISGDVIFTNTLTSDPNPIPFKKCCIPPGQLTIRSSL